MRVVVIYRPNSENARQVEDYITDFNRFHPGAEMEVQSIDTVEGAEMARVYGIMEYPALLAIKDDGQLQQYWMGADKLPLMNDLAYYTNQ
jgi:hypothetical protein